MTRKWMGSKPKACQICGLLLKEVFIDGRIKAGPWAIMCEDCHSKMGAGLGTGSGQKYDLDSLEKLEG